MSIYTKKGDSGETGLFSSLKGKVIRVSKKSLRIEAIGSIDEANSFIGICVNSADDYFKKRLIKIQRMLFTIGGTLAGAKLPLSSNAVESMEDEIDEMDKELIKLTGFILPGGGVLGSHLFMARTLIRRAERRIVKLSQKEKVPSKVLIYLNRLSDYVYTLARYANFKEQIKEESWKQR